MEEILLPETKRYSVKTMRLHYHASAPPPKKPLTSPEGVLEMVKGVFAELDGGESVEHFGAIYLNSQNSLIGFKAFNTGTVDQVAVYPRMIVHLGLDCGAAGIILVHNHPSGNLTPSEDDKRLTRAISEAARLFDIRILDHVIVGRGEHGWNRYSFSENAII